MEQVSAARKAMSMEQRQQLASFWNGPLQWDVAMGAHCTLRAGGPAEALLVASTLPELCRLIGWLEGQAIRWRVIGRGSNILVGSQGFAGVLITLGGEFCDIRRGGSGSAQPGMETVRVGAGCFAGKLVGWCARNGLAGLEFMAGIPGSIGGAVSMNAGAWGGEIGALVEAVTFVDRHGQVHEMARQELAISYRRLRPLDSELCGAVVVEAALALKQGDPQEILDRCRDLIARRRAKQPSGVASAGSFFKNPPGDSAGRLIEAAGLKGLQRGGALVSTKHANFIVNTGSATAADITELMREVQDRVYRFSGILLEPEVHLL
ncbi:MAG TPA: UDP-N-acetylenolpyruvoylglucosamine reductase [Desulfobulbaceae bacterium]|nr:UDP-N-acetylenolpyruvoylglucosamine reductase [Desulfobulbaceae bacterium]